MNNNTKDKKGRKVGSTDSVNVTIEQLLQFVPSTTAVPVRRKWLEQIESLHGVKFVNNQSRAEVTLSEAVIASESARPDSEVVVRQRVELKAEEL